ncbi:hypothetical protein RJP21_04735 [Paenibacillus sp. VCA1]|uniref:hypothetical protein n=1 Tax=Paenibacillus sp. VCA1 TaxID=3039148 RepID=UPI002871EDED|nr:hypothetical protein [Paenibacillus sp. VCA1]MDR9852907.1 hypothetical protein [Paenibacillus sp. VCA1]
MAHNQRELSDLTVKINVDIAEALTGLKAVQREAKKATQALRELEAEVQADGSGKLAVFNRDFVIPRKEYEKTYEQRLEAAGAIDLRDNHRIIDLGNGYTRIEPIDPTKLWKAEEHE